MDMFFVIYKLKNGYNLLKAPKLKFEPVEF